MTYDISLDCPFRLPLDCPFRLPLTATASQTRSRDRASIDKPAQACFFGRAVEGFPLSIGALCRRAATLVALASPLPVLCASTSKAARSKSLARFVLKRSRKAKRYPGRSKPLAKRGPSCLSGERFPRPEQAAGEARTTTRRSRNATDATAEPST